MPSIGHAADLPRAAPPAYVPAMVPVNNWTGFYLGGNIGYAWRSTDITGNFAGANWGVTNDRFMLGGQAGYNWQINQFVVGVEWDFDWADGNKATAIVPTGIALATPPIVGCSTQSWVAVRPRPISLCNHPWLASLQRTTKTNAGWLVGFGVE